jgi:hypothetical protein
MWNKSGSGKNSQFIQLKLNYNIEMVCTTLRYFIQHWDGLWSRVISQIHLGQKGHTFCEVSNACFACLGRKWVPSVWRFFVPCMEKTTHRWLTMSNCLFWIIFSGLLYYNNSQLCPDKPLPCSHQNIRP